MSTKIVTFETSMGTFKAELFTDRMPITCGNFIDLVESGFYDGLHFHRVVPGYMIQFGCPNSTTENVADEDDDHDIGKGSGPPDTTYKGCDGKEYTRDEWGNIEDEYGQKIPNEEQTLSMANAGEPETGGSQFFINVANNKHLNWYQGDPDARHPVFGKVIEGYDDVVKGKLEQVECFLEKPVKPLKMLSVKIEK